MAKKKVVIDTTKDFPVNVSLVAENPFMGNKVKVNNIVVSLGKTPIYSAVELAKLKPIEKYLVVEKIEIPKVQDVEFEVVKPKAEDTSIVEETPIVESKIAEKVAEPIKEESLVVEDEKTNEEEV